MLKGNGQCVICDFGLSARFYDEFSSADIRKSKIIVGTPRYLAPETFRINGNDQISLKYARAADVYALSLVFWELCSRTECSSVPHPYCLPYSDVLGVNPTINDVKDTILDKGFRPKMLSDCLTKDPQLEAE